MAPRVLLPMSPSTGPGFNYEIEARRQLRESLLDGADGADTGGSGTRGGAGVISIGALGVVAELLHIGLATGLAHVPHLLEVALEGIAVALVLLAVPHVKVASGVLPGAVRVTDHSGLAANFLGHGVESFAAAVAAFLDSGSSNPVGLAKHGAHVLLHLEHADQVAAALSVAPLGVHGVSGLDAESAQSHGGANGARVGHPAHVASELLLEGIAGVGIVRRVGVPDLVKGRAKAIVGVVARGHGNGNKKGEQKHL